MKYTAYIEQPVTVSMLPEYTSIAGVQLFAPELDHKPTTKKKSDVTFDITDFKSQLINDYLLNYVTTFTNFVVTSYPPNGSLKGKSQTAIETSLFKTIKKIPT